MELKSLNDSNFTTTQPAFGKDKDGKSILYFVSDRGGKGNMDIYYAQYNSDGTFSAPIALDANVNTEADELSPFYDNFTQTLYFSSAGFAGLGGLDVFSINGFPSAWNGSPHNLGTGVNSSADDMYYVLSKNGRNGFFVSNREGTKSLIGATSGDDIWSFKILTDVIVKVIFANKHDAGEQVLGGVGVSAFKRNTESEEDTAFKFIRRQYTEENEPLLFMVKRGETFKIAAQKEGFKDITAIFSVAADEAADTIEQVYYIDSLAQMERRKIKVGNFYFAFNDTTILDYYHQKLDTLYSILSANATFGLEVQGYADTVGTEEYNLKLSQERADEARRYLISKGIDSTRISATGYGEMMPIIHTDTAVMNMADSLIEAEGRARTRSVEFRLLYDERADVPVIEYNESELIDSVKTGPGYRIVSSRKRSKKR
ncbi:MAG TPA: OmpA family protein, partial [Arachidicoccus sp.]